MAETSFVNVTLYPAFADVFTNDELKGVFHPLCSVTLANDEQLHFVSHNGMWINEDVESDTNNSRFVVFKVIDGKYQFIGNTAVYEGYAVAKQVYSIIQADFDMNGISYLNSKKKTQEYIDEMLSKISDIAVGAFDIAYYLAAFYEYSINKIDYKRSGKFGRFRQVIDGWGKADESTLVYTDSTMVEEMVAEFSDVFENQRLKEIGYTIGSEFFTDGNDNYLCYDKVNQLAVVVNHYG